MGLDTNKKLLQTFLVAYEIIFGVQKEDKGF